MKPTITYVIADNQEGYRRAVRNLLDPPGTYLCLGEAANGVELLDLLGCLEPDVVLLDLEMPVMDGNAAMRQMARLFPQTKVLVLSGYYQQLLVEDFLARGARGYLPKDELFGAPELLARAIDEVYSGGLFVQHVPPEQQLKQVRFSPREKTIVAMMCQDFTIEEIAHTTGTNKRTVERQRKRIYSKLGVLRAVGFFKWAFASGLQFLSSRSKDDSGGLKRHN